MDNDRANRIKGYKTKFKNKQRRKNRIFVSKVKLKFGCSICGYKKNPASLDFHHIRDKKYIIAKMVSSGYSLKMIKSEIRKCIVLCVNCHRKQHFTGNYSHSKRRNLSNTMKQNKQCVFCGESSVSCLDFHHRNPSEKIINVGYMTSYCDYSMEEIIKEIEKCDTVCSNCHRELHYNERLLENQS